MNEDQETFVKLEHSNDPVSQLLSGIRDRLNACIQCGTCTGSCANSHAMDLVPRQIWRMIQMGLEDEVMESKTFWLCSNCYTCTLRCPRGLPLTEAMNSLKHAALLTGRLKDRRSPLFYRAFMDIVRRYGRVRETELMVRYFAALKNPWVPFGFAPLGWKLLRKGKLDLKMPRLTHKGKLDAIMDKVQELENMRQSST